MNRKYVLFSILLLLSAWLMPHVGLADEKQKRLDVGKKMYGHLCYKCHDYGERGAPRLGYKSDWETRLISGKEALITSVMKGKGFMLPTGGGGVSSREKIAVLVDYMASTVADDATSYTPVRHISQGLELYSATCFSCHNTGINNTPRLGDKKAWQKRLKKGVPTLAKSVIAGHGKVITRNDSGTRLNEAEIEDMVRYMLSTVKP